VTAEEARPAGRRRESYAERRARRAEVDDPAVVLDAAARFLEARARSIAEVRRRLTTAGYRSELVDAAIDRLVDLGMLDDRTFAAAWVASRDRARPRGERALRQELAQKGIDRSIADEVLRERQGAAAREDPSADDPDRAAADRLLARNARSLARVADLRQRRARAYALLARNGFDPGTCAEAARAWIADAADPSAHDD
jgi:regulatory protein